MKTRNNYTKFLWAVYFLQSHSLSSYVMFEIDIRITDLLEEMDTFFTEKATQRYKTVLRWNSRRQGLQLYKFRSVARIALKGHKESDGCQCCLLVTLMSCRTLNERIVTTQEELIDVEREMIVEVWRNRVYHYRRCCTFYDSSRHSVKSTSWKIVLNENTTWKTWSFTRNSIVALCLLL